MRYAPLSDEKWPNADQRLLLSAALSPGEAALEAWQRWSGGNDINAIDSMSFFVLPQVYSNLKEFGRDIPNYHIVKGVYRWTWSQNQSTLAGLADLLRLLDRAGVPTLVLKGIPLARHYYRDLAVRMMKDADLLIHAADVPRAIAALRDSEWRQQLRPPSDYLMRFLEAIHYVHPQWPMVDIHWRPWRLDTPVEAENGLWDLALDDDVLGAPTRMPSATDLLLLTCFHARKSDFHNTCRWVLDAMVLVNGAQTPIDWDRLFESSRELGLLLPVRDAISYLHSEFAAPVPEAALQRAWSQDCDAAEQERYRHMIRHGIDPSVRGVVEEHWRRYGDVCPRQGRFSRVAGFTRYFLSHCRRQVTREAMPGLAKRFFWDRVGRSNRAPS